ncbi:MAG: class II fructose-bisphosphate aldolase [Candidatus Saccharimonadales bacterium]
MGHTIQQIRQNCTKARETMANARVQKFAVGAFNIDNQETLIAVAKAAQKLQAPVMVEVSHGEVEAMGLMNVRDMVDNYKQEYGIEMYINLDHSPSVETAKAGIDAGFEFIHIDVSQANHNATDNEIIIILGKLFVMQPSLVHRRKRTPLSCRAVIAQRVL